MMTLNMENKEVVGGTEGINWFNAFTRCMNRYQIIPDSSSPLPLFRDMNITGIKNYIDSCSYPFNSDDVQKEYDIIKEKQNTEKPVLLVSNYKENVKKFYEKQPFFYDRNGLFWFWSKDKKCYERYDDTEILVSIEKELILTGDVISSSIKNTYLEAFRQIGRVNIPKIPPKTWLQFKNCVVDLENNVRFDSSPAYFFCNPLPHNLTEGSQMPKIRHIFKEWVNNHDQLLFEILAYCCLPDYPIHRLFVLIGSGSNGKSKFLELLTNFIGIYNVTSANFEKLTDNSFHTAKLYKKLVCLMGETNFNILEKTDIIKRLTGQDLIDFEFKGKQGFEDYNYAKIVIATNSLPMTSDKTDGFYRRWILIDFPQKFSEQKDILKDIPLEEYDALATYSVAVLHDLIKTRKFSGEGSIEDRKKRYEDKSNPLQKFIAEMFEESFEGFVFKFEFEKEFLSFLKNNNYRIWSNFEINKEMKKLYEDGKKEYKEFGMENKIYWAWFGLKFKAVSNTSKVSKVFTPFHYMGNEHKSVETLETLETLGIFDEKSVNLVHNLLQDSKEKTLNVEVLLKFVTYAVIQKGKEMGEWFEPVAGKIKDL